MIKEKNVIRMKIPYPSIDSGLAVSSHMYICRTVKDSYYEYVKCQTLKPYMLYGKTMQHFHDEDADISRNPFLHKTRIDCDKIFSSKKVEYDDEMKTQRRPDVCDDVCVKIEKELIADGFDNKEMDEEKLKELNPLVH